MNNKIKNYFDENASYWHDLYENSRTIEEYILKERQQLFLSYILKNVSKDKRILDLGGGSGVLSSKLIESGYKVDLIDISENMIAKANQLYEDKKLDKFQNELICNDLLSQNFKKNYHCVAALGFLEYQKDYVKVLNKIYDILEPDGYLLINLPVQKKVGNFFGLSYYVNQFKNIFKKNNHPGLRVVSKSNALKIFADCKFRVENVRNHGYGEIYLANKLIPFFLQKKISKIFERINSQNKFNFLSSNIIFYLKK